MNVERSTARGVAHYPGIPAPAPARVRPLLLILMTALLAACGGGDPVRKPAPSARVAMPRSWPVVEPADPARANAVLMRAIGLVGTPYRWGGNTPESGFDCSGLVNYVFRDMAAVQLPRTSRDLASSGGPKVALESPGRGGPGVLLQRQHGHARGHLCRRRPLRACPEHAVARSAWTTSTAPIGPSTTPAPAASSSKPHSENQAAVARG